MEATLYSGLEIIGGATEKTRKLIFAPVPSSNYNRFSERLRKNIPTELQCALFCGGRRCKYEQSEYWKKSEMAIEGIFSNWITDRILAMSRPNTHIILTKNILEQFKKLGILSLINLQQPGEHSRCGPPLEISGFTYEPELFMKEGISYYNFCMKDYGEASDNRILDMVKVISFALTEGKVAIHCHAGLGRTGVLIACYLIFHLKVSANQAIQFVRTRRPNSIQTRGQIQCCQHFERYMLSLCDIFSNKDSTQDRKSQELTLCNYIKKQQIILHGYECKHFKQIPKILFVLSERLLELGGRKVIQLANRWLPFSEKYLVAEPSPLNLKIISRLSESDLISCESMLEKNGRINNETVMESKIQKDASNVKEISYKQPDSIPIKFCHSGKKKESFKGMKCKDQQDIVKKSFLIIPWRSLPCVLVKDDSVKISSNEVLQRNIEKDFNPEWKRSSEPIIPSKRSDCMKLHLTKETKNSIISNEKPDLTSSMKLPSSSAEGNQVKDKKSIDKQFVKRKAKANHKEKKLTDEKCNVPKSETYSQELMLEAIVCDHSQLKEEEIAHLNKLKGKLTHQHSSWNSLTKEKDACMLSGLLFEWLEHLHKPILGKDELSYIVILGHKPVMCLKKFPPELQFTLEYLLRLVYRMFPNNQDYQYKFLRRLMASLTHQTILIDGSLLPVGKNFPKLREGTLRKSLEFGVSFIEELKKHTKQT